MRTWGSAAAVIAAVRDDAAAEGERLERAADAALAALRSAAVPAPDVPDAAPRVASARRAAAELLADEDWQDTVDAAADRDAWIAAVAQQGRRAFATAPDALAWTAALAGEAVRQLPGSACVVTVPAGLSPAPDDAWRLALEASTGRQITLERGPFPAGCIARTPDARVTFDNRLEAREERMRTEWRAALARIYETAVADANVLEPA
jgi:ParB-like chromosome segregation protein Spo0J